MESDAFVSVCDGTQVFIVDLKHGNQVMKRPMSAEAAIMNPARRGVPESSPGMMEVGRRFFDFEAVPRRSRRF